MYVLPSHGSLPVEAVNNTTHLRPKSLRTTEANKVILLLLFCFYAEKLR